MELGPTLLTALLQHQPWDHCPVGWSSFNRFYGFYGTIKTATGVGRGGHLVFENFFYMADELRRGRMACEHFLDSLQKLNKCYFPWWPVHQQCNSSILAVLIPLYFERIQFQTQSPGKGTRSCRGALSPLPDLWTAQWGSWKLRPLKDYLDFSQAYWDNLRAKSLCSFHINLQSERCQSRVVHYVSVCILNECITECSHGVF